MVVNVIVHISACSSSVFQMQKKKRKKKVKQRLHFCSCTELKHFLTLETDYWKTLRNALEHTCPYLN
ncbi:unnamed protein product [Staurois parvus]|uniref:Uncharacterized protein n=1 Tax=Staurois parvus TaxID=386267 RepID=A0ABN9CMU4_9NEOB|nr:unnamed protein product [Staurois parvus]